jgi:hypothetical protein
MDTSEMGQVSGVIKLVSYHSKTSRLLQVELGL